MNLFPGMGAIHDFAQHYSGFPVLYKLVPRFKDRVRVRFWLRLELVLQREGGVGFGLGLR